MLYYCNIVLFLGVATSTIKTQQCSFHDVLKFGVDERLFLNNGRTKSYEPYNHSVFLEKPENSYRFYPVYLDWSKLLPGGYTSKVNQTEVNMKKQMMDYLLQNDLNPVVTIYSGNLPPMFSPLGGWTNPNMVSYFAYFARSVFRIFGDRVKTWVTFHEPREICESFQGLTENEFPLGVGEYLCAHNILKAHAEAYRIYDQEFRNTHKGKISITLDFTWMEPKDPTSLQDIFAAEQKMHFQFGLYAHPILNFDYPEVVIRRVARRSELEGFIKSRLPKFTYVEKTSISQTYDFLQITYKGVMLVQHVEKEDDAKPSLTTDSGGRLHEKNFRKLKYSLKQETSIGPLINWIQVTSNNPEMVFHDNPM